MAGYSWRGRHLNWNPDWQRIEQERQRWVMEQLADQNELTILAARDPAEQYEAHRNAFIETGDENQLRLMLEYVRAYQPS